MATKKNEEQDRTILAEQWSTAVAELDEARERLAHAEKSEREAWDALQRSRSFSVPPEET